MCVVLSCVTAARAAVVETVEDEEKEEEEGMEVTVRKNSQSRSVVDEVFPVVRVNLQTQQRRQYDGLVHLQLRAQLQTMKIPNCTLKATEGLTGFRNPAGHFVIDFGATGEGTAQVRKVLHHLQLSSVHADLRRVGGAAELGGG
ncbi:hypothetical protein SprV_0100405100 [Sparganum proliferum]